MTIEEKASEYAEKSFPSDDISNNNNNDIACQSYIAGANWMKEKALEWFKHQKEEIGISWFDDYEIRFREAMEE